MHGHLNIRKLLL